MRKKLLYLTIAMVLTLAITAGVATASPLCNNVAPTGTTERIPVCTTIPGLGGQVFLPASDFVALVSFEDIEATRYTCSSGLPGDCDFNEGQTRITGDWATKTLMLTYLDNFGAGANDVSWAGGGPSLGQVGQSMTINMPWIEGSELVLLDHAYSPQIGTNYTWSTGPGSRNVDGFVHAIVQVQVGVSPSPSVAVVITPPPVAETPEPATCVLFGGGLIVLGLIRPRKTRK